MLASIGDSLPDEMEPLWVGTDWMIGVQKVKCPLHDKVVFRKFKKKKGAQLYVKSWEV